MSELGLTLARLAFLALLWGFVLSALWALRRDLRMPADARPAGRVRPPRPAKATLRGMLVRGSQRKNLDEPKAILRAGLVVFSDYA